MNKKYIITDKETNNWPLGECNTLEDAENCILEFEKEDRADGNYKPDFYEILVKE